MTTQERTKRPADHPQPDGLNGATIIDESGAERPITETMVRRALEELDEDWSRQADERRRRGCPKR